MTTCDFKGYTFCKLVKELEHHPDLKDNGFLWAAGCPFLMSYDLCGSTLKGMALRLHAFWSVLTHPSPHQEPC